MEKEAPTYTSGFLAIMICYAIGLVASIVLRFYLVWENKRRDTAAETVPLGTPEETNVDKTDKQLRTFRYIY